MNIQTISWACLAEGFNATVSDGGLNIRDKLVNPGCWLRSGLVSARGRLVLSLFQDPISYGHFTGATLYVPCLDRGQIKLYPFFHLHLYCLLNLNDTFFVDSMNQ